MLAVSGTEGIHYVAVGVRSELLSEYLLLLLHILLGSFVSWIGLLDAYWLAFLFGIVAEVLEEEHLTWLQSSSLGIGLSAVGSELNLRYTESSSNCLLDLTKAEFWLHLSLGLAHVAHDDESTTLLKNEFEGRNSTANTGVVSNLTVLKRYIEIYTYDGLFASEIIIFNFHLYINLKCG